jgi:hypothetical protein
MRALSPSPASLRSVILGARSGTKGLRDAVRDQHPPPGGGPVVNGHVRPRIAESEDDVVVGFVRGGLPVPRDEVEALRLAHEGKAARPADVDRAFALKRQKKTTVTFIDDERAFVVTPDLRGKALVALYYRERYGVDIRAVKARQPKTNADSYYRGLCDQLFASPGDFRMGVVVTQGFGEDDHVTPIAVERKNGIESILVLDSVGRSEHWARVLKRPRLQAGALTVQRQADNETCHVDAMVVLKEVLRFEGPLSELLLPRLRGKRFMGIDVARVPAMTKVVQCVRGFFEGVGASPDLVIRSDARKTLTREEHARRHGETRTRRVATEVFPADDRNERLFAWSLEQPGPQERDDTRALNHYNFHKAAEHMALGKNVERDVGSVFGDDVLEALVGGRILTVRPRGVDDDGSGDC